MGLILSEWRLERAKKRMAQAAKVVSVYEEPSLKEYYDYTSRQIQREEALINNRLSWMLTFEGFLFAGVALVANGNTDPTLRSNFRYTIPVLGSVVALLTTKGIHAAYLSINHIQSSWEARLQGGRFPPAYGNSKASFLGRLTGYGIPTAMTLAWITLLTLQVFR
jgi:hypothetical protein